MQRIALWFVFILALYPATGRATETGSGDECPFGRTNAYNVFCNEQDEYCDVEQGDVVWARSVEERDFGGNCGLNNVPCNCFDQCLAVQQGRVEEYWPALQQMCSDDENPLPQPLAVATRIPEKGQIRFSIKEADAKGEGRVFTAFQNITRPVNATRVFPGVPQFASIPSCNTVKTFTFPALTGTFTLIHVRTAPDSRVRPMVEVWDKEGRPYPATPHPGGILVDLFADTEMRVLVYSEGSETGEFEIVVAQPGVCPECGDCDKNGLVAASDALVVLRLSVGLPGRCSCPQDCPADGSSSVSGKHATCTACGDFDANGALVATDALRVLKFSIGQLEFRPFCPRRCP